jgi:hypothetical protein
MPSGEPLGPFFLAPIKESPDRLRYRRDLVDAGGKEQQPVASGMKMWTRSCRLYVGSEIAPPRSEAGSKISMRPSTTARSNGTQ